MQLLTRTCIGGRNDKNIKNDNRLSEFNYGSRSNYSTQTAILEKISMYDLAARERNIIMHNTSCLKACYDRQLPNIGYMMQEAVGVERNLAQTFEKVLPMINHYVCTNFGISNKTYGSKYETLGGTGQGNSVSGSICRDTTCIIFKHLEDRKLEFNAVSPMNKKMMQRIVISFVDDTDFYTSGEEHKEKCNRLWINAQNCIKLQVVRCSKIK